MQSEYVLNQSECILGVQKKVSTFDSLAEPEK